MQFGLISDEAAQHRAASIPLSAGQLVEGGDRRR